MIQNDKSPSENAATKSTQTTGSANEQPTGAIDDAKAFQVLAEVERSERRLQKVHIVALTGIGRPIYMQHFFIFGAARRALAQSSAFRQMVDAKNGLVAAALVRLQLDTVLRLYAIFWVSNPEDFAQRVMDGEQIDRIKASDGNVMKDVYLRKRLAPRNPWINEVYKQSSGFIHFSKHHMISALSAKTDGGPGEVQMDIGPTDFDATVGYYGELLKAFLHMNDMIVVAMEDALLRIDGKQLE